MSRTIAVLLVLALGAPVLFADATIERISRTTMLSGMGELETEETAKYEGDKKAEDYEAGFVGGMMGAFGAGGGRGTRVTRLDLDLIWDFDHANMTYTERPLEFPDFEEMEGFSDSMQVTVESRGSYEIVNTELTVTGPGEEKAINGFPCEEWVLTYLVEMLEEESGTEMTQEMTVELWVTPMTGELEKVSQTELEFSRKLFEKWDTDASPEDMQNLGMGMLTAMYGVSEEEAGAELNEVAEKMSEIEGYPIVTEVEWGMKSDLPVEEDVEEEPETGFPTSLGNLRGIVQGKMAEEIEKSIAKPDLEFKFSSYVEVKSVSTGDVPSSDFDKKEGYKKVETKPVER